MAFEYFLYRTDFSNTLVDRSVTSFAPLPPNTDEIYIDFVIPVIQPLYLYREYNGSIILNDEDNINNYLNSIASPLESGDTATVGFVTGETKNYLPLSGGNLYGGIYFNNSNTGDTRFGQIIEGVNGGMKIAGDIGINLSSPYLILPNASGFTGSYLTIGQDGLITYTSAPTGNSSFWQNTNEGPITISQNVQENLNVQIILDVDVENGNAEWHLKIDNDNNQSANIELKIYKNSSELLFTEEYSMPREENDVLYGSIPFAALQESGSTFDLEIKSSVSIEVSKVLFRVNKIGDDNVIPTWGNIIGTLSNQTDLQNELDNKINTILNATGNLGTFLDDGNLSDSGIALSGITGLTITNALQVRRSSDYSITTSYTEIPFDIVDVETNPDSIEHDNVNTERINIKEDGLYFIYFDGQTTNTSTTTQVDIQIYLNGTQVIPGGESVTNTYQNEIHKITDGVIVNLSAGDYITMRIMRNETSATLLQPATLLIYSLKGLRGEKGIAGDKGEVGFGMFAYAKTLSDGTLENNYNLSVNRVTDGTYDYTFDIPTLDNKYGVFAQPFGTTTDTNTEISNVTTNSFRVEIGVGDNGTTPDVLTDTDHSVVVFGPPPILTGSTGVTWGGIGGDINYQTDLIEELDKKIDKVTGATGNLGVFNNSGNLDDSGVALSDITGHSGLYGICELIDSVGGRELNNVSPIALIWDTNEFIDNDFYIHNVGTSTVTVKKSGYYEISYNINSDNQTNSRVTTGIQVRWQGSTLISKTLTASYSRNNSNDDNHNSLPPCTIQLNANEYVEVVGFRLGDDNSVLTKANASFFRIKYLGE